LKENISSIYYFVFLSKVVAAKWSFYNIRQFGLKIKVFYVLI